MKRMGIGLGMAAIVALAAGTALAQTQTETLHNRGEFTQLIENPCTGEEVLVEGRFHNVIHTTLNENGYHFVTRGTVIDASGTGLQTGDKYRFVNPGGVTGYSEIEGEVGGQNVYNDELTFLVVSEGASPDFLMHLVFKFTFDADGHPNTVVEAGTVRCTS